MTTQTDNDGFDAAAAAASGSARQQGADDMQAVSQAGLDRALRQWLPGYCRQVPGLTRAFAIAAGSGDGPSVRQVGSWPDQLECPARVVELGAVSLYGRTSVTKVKSAAGWTDRVVMPVTHKNRILGGLICEADNLSSEQREALLKKVTGGMAPAAPAAATAAAGSHHRLEIVIDLLAVCLDASHAQAARMAFVTEVAAGIGCDRVSYGHLSRGRTRVLAMSNSARIERRSNLVRAIEACMDEAVEQSLTISYPGAATDRVDRAHARLARDLGGAHVLTIPLVHEEQLVGALTLERHGPTPMGEPVIALCQSLASVAGPILELRHRDESPLTEKIGARGRETLGELIGPRHKGAKMLALIATLAAAWLSFASGTYRITAPARLEGSVNRAIVAPMDGFVASAGARAGDRLEADSVLAQLDDRELKLELSKWSSELDQLRRQYRSALASHDRATTAIVNAQIARAVAQVELLESQLARTNLTAPIAGIVVAGDLSQLLGSPVERGQVLFEIAPLDDYRVVLEVDERDMRAIAAGQTGRLALEGLPSQRLEVVIDKITPVATARDGRNYFRVEAHLRADAQPLRPGMAGIAKIDAGERRLAWIWTHRLIDWMRLRLWRWRP